MATRRGKLISLPQLLGLRLHYTDRVVAVRISRFHAVLESYPECQPSLCLLLHGRGMICRIGRTLVNGEYSDLTQREP